MFQNDRYTPHTGRETIVGVTPAKAPTTDQRVVRAPPGSVFDQQPSWLACASLRQLSLLHAIDSDHQFEVKLHISAPCIEASVRLCMRLKDNLTLLQRRLQAFANYWTRAASLGRNQSIYLPR